VLRQARVLIIALCLACFATVAWSVARANRATAAQFQVGARTVVTVAPQPAGTLIQAVERVDPRGRFAMAAIGVHTPSTTLLGVQAQRLPATVSWPRGISARSLASVVRALQPPTVPAIQLPEATVRVQARTTITAARGDVELGMWVFNGTGGTAIIDLGTLHAGNGTYGGDLAGVCPSGCQLTGFGILPVAGHRLPVAGSVQLSIARVWSQLQDGLSRPVSSDLVPDGWRSTATGARVGSGSEHGLTLTVTDAAIDAVAAATGALTPPMASPADHPGVLPAVVTSELESLNADAQGSVPTQGLDGNTIGVRPVVIASSLPRIGTDASLIDLELLANVEVGPNNPDTTDEVWLGPRAPADALARLRAAGLAPIDVQRSSSVFKQMQQSAPALADDFLLVATIAALLLATASTLGALGATTRERATELVSLEVSGVPRRVLVRSLGLESVILNLTALCGAGAGALAAVIAIPSLPELSSTSSAPLQYGLPAPVIVAVLLAVIVAVSLAAAAVTAALLRRMSPALLRTVPDDISG
jgi:putative ABC transport system permease protein